MLSPCPESLGSLLLRQALQQVVGAAAIYKYLLVKHGVVSAKRGAGSDGADASVSGEICGCGGAVGSCKVCAVLHYALALLLLPAAEQTISTFIYFSV